jgi:hypothetical protein
MKAPVRRLLIWLQFQLAFNPRRMTMPKPIVENTDALPATAASLLRTGLGILGPVLVAKGIVSADSLPGVVALLTSAVSVAYGVYRTHARQSKLVAARDTGARVIGTK